MQYLEYAYIKKNIGYFKFKFDCTSYFLPVSSYFLPISHPPRGVGTCQAIWEDDVPGECSDWFWYFSIFLQHKYGQRLGLISWVCSSTWESRIPLAIRALNL